MSTAAPMAASSGSVPNMIDGQATTPASMDTAASSSGPWKHSSSMVRSGRWPSVLILCLIRAISSTEAHWAIPSNTRSSRNLEDGLTEDLQLTHQIGAQVTAAFMVGQFTQAVESDGDQVEPCRPVGVQRGLRIAGDLGDAGVRDGIGALAGQHAEGGASRRRRGCELPGRPHRCRLPSALFTSSPWSFAGCAAREK